MTTSSIDVLEPTGQVQKLAPLQLSPVGELKGCRVAILDNAKPNFQRLATLLAERLGADFPLAEIKHFRKENPAVGAGAELLDKIAKSADLVLAGSAD
jgi:hypothetical protein